MAWGSKGRRIIGLIARELLSPETSAAIGTIMGTADLATFGLYLDDNKDRLEEQIPGSRAWHYDNIPICGRKPHSEYCPNGWCASAQIARHRDILADPHESKARKQFAIWVLTHLIGDIHQPLHAADHDDRGGNMIKVRLPWGRNANLHGAWDTDFIERALGGKNEKLVAHELLLKFASKKTDWETGTIQAWMESTRQDGRVRKDPRLHVRCRADAHADSARSELCRQRDDSRGRTVGKGRVPASPRPQS
jgi:hypothetical protein